MRLKHVDKFSAEDIPQVFIEVTHSLLNGVHTFTSEDIPLYVQGLVYRETLDTVPSKIKYAIQANYGIKVGVYRTSKRPRLIYKVVEKHKC